MEEGKKITKVSKHDGRKKEEVEEEEEEEERHHVSLRSVQKVQTDETRNLS